MEAAIGRAQASEESEKGRVIHLPHRILHITVGTFSSIGVQSQFAKRSDSPGSQEPTWLRAVSIGLESS